MNEAELWIISATLQSRETETTKYNVIAIDVSDVTGPGMAKKMLDRMCPLMISYVW